MYFRQIFLKRIYFSSCKIPENCISYSSKWSSALYWLCNDSLYAKGSDCNIYLFMWKFTHMLSLTREGPYFILRNKGKCQTCSLNFASFSLQWNSTILFIRWWNPHSCCQWHEEDLSEILDGRRSWSYFDIELFTISTLKRYNHYN